MKKKNIIILLCLSFILFCGNAEATLTLTNWDETASTLDVEWSAYGYNGSMNYVGTWWSVSLSYSADHEDAYNDSYSWEVTHINGPHDDDVNPASYSKTSTPDPFSSSGYVYDSGSFDHTPHSDMWTFNVNHHPTSTPNLISLNVVHTPEPVSSTLFIVGGAILGYRCFRKKK